MPPLPLPDPPLADPAAGLVLRPWGRPGDAAALAAAWADPEVAAHTAVPADRSREAAARWVAGEHERRRRGLALDLVIAATDGGAGQPVLGEVGLANIDAPDRAEVGFWLAPEARGRGVAAAAVRLLTAWALAPSQPREAAGSGASPRPRPGPGASPDSGASPGSGGSPGPGASPDSGPGPGAGLGLRQVWARTMPGDDRAAGVLVRAGFRRQGEAAGTTVWAAGPAMLRP